MHTLQIRTFSLIQIKQFLGYSMVMVEER